MPNIMKKTTFLICFILVLLVAGCSVILPPEKGGTAESYYNFAMYYFEATNLYEAIPAFEQVREKFPLSPYATLAELRLGDSHYRKEEYIEAINYFDNFRRLHPSNQHVAYSIFMAGMCHYMEILSPDRDQTSAKEALEHFQLLAELYPASPYTGKSLCKIYEAKQRIAENEFFIGSFYLKKKNYKGAIKRFKGILRDYPHAMKKDRILFYLAKAVIESGEKQKGEALIQLLLKNYPASSYARQAEDLLKTEEPRASSPV